MNNLFICHECGQKFSTFCWLTRHANKVHESYKQYFLKHEEPHFHKCPFCDNERKWEGSKFSLTCGSKECKRKQMAIAQANIDQTAKFKKANETYKKRTGFDHPAQNPDVTEKKKQTCLVKYGSQYTFTSESVKEKIKQTTIERYGVENPSQAEVIKEKKKATFNEKYGVDTYSQTAEWIDKTKQTNLDKFGKEWAQQTSEFARNVKHKFYNKDGICFASRPEMKVYDYCVEMGYEVKYQPKSIVYYDLVGKKHYYQPDFLINGKLCEVKGDFMWKDGHLYNPYKRTSDKNLSIEQKNMITACKDKCMSDNGVTVLLQSQIMNGTFKELITEMVK